MTTDASGVQLVNVCASFNVRSQALPEFCEAAGRVLAHARSDEGNICFDMQREIGWARQVSDPAQSLFMVLQSWESADALEQHVKSPHALHFDSALKDSGMLACAPNLSLFSSALNPDDLKAMAAQARADGNQEEVDVLTASGADLPGKRPTSRSSGRGGYLNASSGARAGSGTRSQSSSAASASARQPVAKAKSRSGSQSAAWK